MRTNFDAIAFGAAWADAWNRRDLEAVLAHFADHAKFTSPVAQQLGLAESGVIIGKSALRAYWSAALAKNPNLHFHVLSVYAGVDTIIIRYENQNGVERTEVLSFEEDMVVVGHGAFIVDEED